MELALHSELPQDHRLAVTVNMTTGKSGPLAICIDRRMTTSIFKAAVDGKATKVSMVATMDPVTGACTLRTLTGPLYNFFARPQVQEEKSVVGFEEAKSAMKAFEAACEGAGLTVKEGPLSLPDHYSFVRAVRDHAPKAPARFESVKALCDKLRL